ncbi:hypothetical protein GGQ19_000170 [Salinibacter ruber]|nr:hypothetical protein [Salinibacter ruber]
MPEWPLSKRSSCNPRRNLSHFEEKMTRTFFYEDTLGMLNRDPDGHARRERTR